MCAGYRMKELVVKSWLLLLYFEVVMRVRTFDALHTIVLRERIRANDGRARPSAGEICHAVALACVFYAKQVLCLQRSAATTLLLRRFGWPAELVIGVQLIPFKSHAWVEIECSVVNDKPYMLEIYQVLDRC